MSTVEETQTQQGPEPAERRVLHRNFASQLAAPVGRTIDVRIVPYGDRITHNDGLGGVPKGVPYEEEWMFGSFSEQVHAASVAGRAKKVLVNFEHKDDLLSQVGHGIALREESDGLYGTFEIHEDQVGDKALLLVREGVVVGISLEAKISKSIRTAAGVVQRAKAHLYSIALTRFPAYERAQVLALRDEQEEPVIVDEALLPVDLDPEIVERCRRLGIELPQRYEAHPAETDTPDTSGTSEDGTRQTDDNTTSTED